MMHLQPAGNLDHLLPFGKQTTDLIILIIVISIFDCEGIYIYV
jgi:hypothetical protein